MGEDENSTFIINEAAMKEFGWENAIGKTFETATVAENFHFESVHNEIVRAVYFIDANWRN